MKEWFSRLRRFRSTGVEAVRKGDAHSLSNRVGIVCPSISVDVHALEHMFAVVLFPFRRVKKEDMRRIAKATGATIVTTLADMEGNESFDPEVLGEADEVNPYCGNR